MKINKFLLLIAFLGAFSLTQAQYGSKVNHEVGIFLGPTFMQTDYGEAKEFSSSANNMGFSFGFAYIAGFSEGTGFFAQHLKIKASASYSKANLEYDGAASDGVYGEQERFNTMKGDTKVLSIAISPEIYIFNIADDKLFQPYLSVGIAYVSANPSMKSTVLLPSIYLPESENVFMENQNTFSFNGGAGFRLQFESVAIVFEGILNAFASDKIDGLDADYSGDKYEDTQVNLNLGVVFNID